MLPQLGADATIQLGQSDDALAAAFAAQAGEEGYDLVIDYLWGHPTEVFLTSIEHNDAQPRSGRIRLLQAGDMAGPEPAGRLVAGPLRVAVLHEARPPSFRRPALPCWSGRAELVEEARRGKVAEGEPAVLSPPLAGDPRVARQVGVVGCEQRRQVVLAQEPPVAKASPA